MRKTNIRAIGKREIETQVRKLEKLETVIVTIWVIVAFAAIIAISWN